MTLARSEVCEDVQDVQDVSTKLDYLDYSSYYYLLATSLRTITP
jgi:hypothetical protein